MVDTERRELCAPLGELLDGLAGGEAAAQRDLDLVGVTPYRGAGAGQDVQLVPERCAVVGDVEEVARVRVAGDQGQGPLLAHPADEHPGPGDGNGVVDRLLEPVAGSVERSDVVVPQVRGELQQLLEQHEPFGGALEPQPGHGRLVGLVAGAHTQPGAAAGEHVERGDDLDEQRGRTDRRPRDHGAELHRVGHRSEVPERGVGLEHRFVDGRGRVHLQEVIGDPQRVDARTVDPARQVDQVATECVRAVGPRVVGEADAELHVPSDDERGVRANTGWWSASATTASSDDVEVMSNCDRTNRAVGIAR